MIKVDIEGAREYMKNIKASDDVGDLPLWVMFSLCVAEYKRTRENVTTIDTILKSKPSSGYRGDNDYNR